MKETTKTYAVKITDQNGDSRQQMTMSEIQSQVQNGRFLFVDTELVSADKVSTQDLDGATEILLATRLVGG
jgi:hypothetical protein